METRFLIITGVFLAAVSACNPSSQEVVTYEAFSAVGDGVHDDMPAIVAAHNHANTNELFV